MTAVQQTPSKDVNGQEILKNINERVLQAKKESESKAPPSQQALRCFETGLPPHSDAALGDAGV